MRQFTQDDDDILIWMTERGNTNRYIAQVFSCPTMDIIKRQYWLRLKGRLKK